MGIFDTHCHLNSPQYDRDRTEVLRRALDAGVTRLLVVGYDLPSSRAAVELAESRPEVFASVGIHPHDATSLDDRAFAELERLCASRRVIAIGETGLDYFRNLSPRRVQQEAFRRQLRLAKATDLPVIVHDRDAHDEVLAILKEELKADGRVILHCFSGDVRILRICKERGYYVSFAGSITYYEPKRSISLLRAADENRILVETDAPYLTPQPERGHRNEPAFIRSVIQRVAQDRGVDFDDIARITTRNALQAFNLQYSHPGPSLLERSR